MKRHRNIIANIIVVAVGLLTLVTTPVVAQSRFQRSRKLSPDEQQGLRLLRRMVHPTANYSGEQITEITAQGGRSSRQFIKGDTRGRLRYDFIAPAPLADDVMLIAPEGFRHYHARTNTLDMAFWPLERTNRELWIMRQIAERKLRVEVVGEEVVAGRPAAIVVVAPQQSGPVGFSAKFWIDRETGIRLKQEINNAMGLVSRSYFTRIVIGPDANVTGRDFQARFPRARLRTLFPEDGYFSSVQEAGDRLPFRPLEPTNLPLNFRLNGVWIVGEDGPRATPAVLLRYSNGVGDFALFQRRLRLRRGEILKSTPRNGKGMMQRWRIVQNDDLIELTFVGHLPGEQIDMICESLW